MITSETKEILSCDDFELNIKRTNALKYKVSYPSDKEIKAVVFIVPGFGEDTNSDYLDKLRHYVAETFGVAAVNAYYHCFNSRPNNGAILEFDDIDVAVLQDVAKLYEVDFSTLEEINKNTVLEHFNTVLTQRKAEGKMQADKTVMLSMTLVPQNEEYQNFGMMQAIDHINVLLDIKKEVLNIAPDATSIFLGSSHGGYIAHLAAKIAPSLVDYVIDNSSYATPPLQYIVGKETNINQPEYLIHYEHLSLHCFVQTMWTTNRQSSYCFSDDRYRIRNLMDEEHLKKQHDARNHKTTFISYHSTQDRLAPTQEKVDFYEKLKTLGFAATLHLISEEDVDGRFIKTLDHGMDMSIKELINIELPKILEQAVEKKSEKEAKNIYRCDTLSYDFKVQNNHLQCRCSSN